MFRFCCTLVLFYVLLGSATFSFGTDSEWAYVQNDSVKVGIKKSSGGAIGWLSQVDSQKNLVNHFDHGRMIQQSYYGTQDGSLWAGKPWRWNPVQGGDYRGQPATILEMKQSPHSLYVKTLPKHWATGADIDEMSMEQWVELKGPVVHLRFKMTYHGKQNHPPHDQEIPAIFLDRSLSTLVLGGGKDGGISLHQPGFPNERYQLPQHWAAYIDDQKQGLGIYVPQSNELTCYRFGNPGQRGSCSYLAPLRVFAIQPGMTFEYDCYVTIGTLEAIQNRFDRLSAAEKQSLVE